VKRRDALMSIAISGVAVALPACRTSEVAPAGSLTEDQMRAVLRLNGMDLEPGEAPSVLASFAGSRFATPVDPAIQPQSDFDPEVEP
jgi:hypothetical protein